MILSLYLITGNVQLIHVICLSGIPNTAHFANVTQIEDAMALWEKLKIQKFDEAWKPDQEEEYEDSKGNVVNKKTYEDLKRQGLLWRVLCQFILYLSTL